MTPDDLRDALSRQPVPWNEIRARRGLSAVLAGWRRARVRRRIARAIGVAGVTGALAVTAVVLILRTPAPQSSATATQSGVALPAPVQGAEHTSVPAGWSTLVLADGSRAFLDPQARLVVDGPRAPRQRLLVRQEQGTVRYEVRHDPALSFVVRAGPATVRVIGTVFTVTIASEGSVTVTVDQGVVEVDDGQRRVHVPAGEHIRVTAENDAPERPLHRPKAPHDEPTPARPKEVQPPKPQPAPPSADVLLSRADAARQTRDFAGAAAILRDLIERYPRDTRLAAVLFTLGTLERDLGHAAAAAEAFDRCRGHSPAGPLAEDATAAAATAWQAAGDRPRAQRAAADYLSQFPHGSRRSAMQEIVR